MSARHLLRLAAALAVLLLLWGAVAVESRRGRDVEQAFRLPRVVAADVDTVTLTGVRDTVVLTRVSGSVWRVNDHPADEHMITELLTSLGDTSATGELVAQSAASYRQLGMDSSTARRVRVRVRGSTVLDVVAGKPGVQYGTGYIRLPSDSAVYLIRSALPEAAGRHPNDWRDLRIASVPPDSIGTIDIQRGTKRFTVTRQAGARWTLAPGGATDSMAVQNLLRALRDVRAGSFADARQTDSLNAAKPTRRLRVFGLDRAPLLSLLFDSTGAGVWVHHDTGGTVWRLEGLTADQLTPAESTLAQRRAKAPPKTH